MPAISLGQNSGDIYKDNMGSPQQLFKITNGPYPRNTSIKYCP